MVKLDMHKAYDMVELRFLREMMKKMSFVEWWINLIMECVISVSYRSDSVQCRLTVFLPTRELRQGDPLSPIYSRFVLKAYLICYPVLKLQETSLGSRYVGMHRRYPTFYSQMTLLFL